MRVRWRTALERKMIAESGLFEADWYLSAYSDVVGAEIDPQTHYVRHGAGERRDPSPLFETEFYLSQYPGLDPAAVNPLCHYLTIGDAEGARPNRYFDPRFYRAQIGEDALRRVNSLSHYLSLGPKTPIDPGPTFAAAGYLDRHPGVAEAGINPLWHFLASARRPAGAPGDSSVGPFRRDPAPGAGELLEVGSFSHLEHVGNRGGLGYWRVAGRDPQLVLARRDGKLIEPGHYKLMLEFAGPVSLLGSAKLYFDTGAGFSEREISGLRFEQKGKTFVAAAFSISKAARALRFDPTDHRGLSDGAAAFGLGASHLRRLGRVEYYARLLGELSDNNPGKAISLGAEVLRSAVQGGGGLSKAAAELRARKADRDGVTAAFRTSHAGYLAWIEQYDQITNNDRAAMKQRIDEFSLKPKISIVMPVFDAPEKLLREAIESVLDQTYDNWELCIADDCSLKPHVKAVLTEYMRRDRRVKVVFRKENGHISKASNSALEVATGEWVALLDHDDRLAPHALFCIVEAINKRPDSKLIYSDEDKIDLEGRRHDAYFKSDWNYHLFLSHNMVSHLGAYSKKLIDEIGGFRADLVGSQDYDLALRCVERIDRSQIVHIPHVLYHWRVTAGSTSLSADEKPYAMIAGERAINEHLRRVGIPGRVKLIGHGYRLLLDAPAEAPKVSIIIPTRDGGSVLRTCVDSILSKTDYKNYEIIIVDNGSVDRLTLDYIAEACGLPNVSSIRDARPFNYSALNNSAVAHAEGELIAFVNDDIEVLSGDWLTELVKVVSLSYVGAVGPRLWYPYGELQHAGLVLSPSHIAINIHKGMSELEFGYFGRAVLMQELSALTAACLLVKRSVFEDVGGFDEANLGIAYNDVDLCLKIRSRGHAIVLAPDVNLTHHESATRGSDKVSRKRARLIREQNFMRRKWSTLLAADPAYNPNLTLEMHNFALAFPPRQPRPWNAIIERTMPESN